MTQCHVILARFLLTNCHNNQKTIAEMLKILKIIWSLIGLVIRILGLIGRLLVWIEKATHGTNR
jgi:hypothetical protein